MAKSSNLLQIEKVQTTANHPETNGYIERMHSTLEGMLSNAKKDGIDWVDQLPLALAALRQCPNRFTGFSPSEMVYGRNVRGPLDLLSWGWKEKRRENWKVSEWVEQLAEKIEREIATEEQMKAVEDRKRQYDERKLLRKLEVGDLILERIPGLDSKLQESWRGPCKVLECLGELNY